MRPAWTRQPGSATGLDKSSPLARGLTGFINAGPGLKGDLVSGQPAWGVTGAQIATPDGYSIGNATAGTNGVYWDRSSNTATRGPSALYAAGPIMSAAAVLTPLAYDSDVGVFGSSAGSDGWFIRSRFSNGTIQATLNDGSIRVVHSSPGKLLLGKRNVIVMTCDGATLSLYSNGEILGTVAVGGTGIAYDASFSQVQLGGAAQPFGAVGFSGVPHLGVVWNRCLPANEVAALASNPWRLFAPNVVRYTVSASGLLVPVLSAATVTAITTTTAKPRVTITF